jgi:mannose-1-phosphate guanylyltransferase
MFKASFEWCDVGAWSSVYDLNPKDEQGNVSLKKNSIFIDTENSLVFSMDDKPVAVIGLNNVAVINTENGILVGDLKHLQKVKKVAEHLKIGKK